MTIILNKKEYHDTTIVKVHHEEYFNLKIIPSVGILEREIGLLNDLANEYLSNVKITNYSLNSSFNFV